MALFRKGSYFVYEGEQEWHWKHSFVWLGEFDEYDLPYQKMYDWCLETFEDVGGWHVQTNGIIIRREEDAMLFKLTWC